MASTSSSETNVHSVGVRNFVAARVAEIASLTTQINNSGATNQGGRVRGFSFQHVSKHMRRRAVSHNPKRLPTRLRPSHLHQLLKSSGGVKKQPKRPSRCYRKRTDGDILEYNRRQLGKPIWLESHIWHAKRFHMKPLWGKKLAIAPTAKCFRSLFGAAKNGAIMQDISYLCCLELTGLNMTLVKGISAVVPEDFLRFDTSTERTGHIYSPQDGSYIGAMRYLWVSISNESDSGKLIMWLHPTSKTKVIDCLVTIFNLEVIENSANMQSFPESPNNDEKKYLWRTIDNPMWNNTAKSVYMRDLTGCVNRIRLTGKKTLPVLKEVLKVGTFKTEDGKAEATKEKQVEFWENLKRVIDLPSDSVISLNVVDPRLELPKKRERTSELKHSDEDKPPVLSDACIKSLLWNQDVRNNVLRTKTSDAQLANIRSQNLIPGTAIEHQLQPNVIPIVLVLRSGRSSKYDSSPFIGADLLVPLGWFMPFWIALSFRCVRAYGLEFSDYLSFEEDPYLLNMPVSTILSPDSSSYLEESDRTAKELKTDYYSRPPAKRHNLIKLGCAFPFSIDWSRFTRFICGNEESSANVQVLRKESELFAVFNFLRHKVPLEDSISETALTPVQVTLQTGASESRACIYIPTLEDLKLFANGKLSDHQILQEAFKDVNEKHRDELLRQHHKRMSHLRKKRKVARRAAESKDFDLHSRLEELDSKDESDKFNEKMNGLWVNSNIEEVLAKQDREVLGITTYAHYSFRKGKAGASGYANVKQLKKLVEIYDQFSQTESEKFTRKLHSELLVLVRNWGSGLTYRWAKLSVPSVY